MLYRAARREWEQQLKDLKLAAKLKASVSAPVVVEASARRKVEAVAAEGKVETTSATRPKAVTVVRQKGRLARGPSVDVEVAVLGAEDSDEADDGSEGEAADGHNDAHTTELAEGRRVDDGITGKRGYGEALGTSGAVKKRKVSSHSGNITSRSSKNHKAVDARLAAAKAVGQAHAEALAAKNGGSGRNSGGGSGMFGASGRSIGEVDREMQAKKDRSKKHASRG